MYDIIIMIVALIAATLRMATPLIFAGLGGVFSEKSGVVNIGLEGMMAIGAFFSVYGTYKTESPYLGLLIGMIAGGLVALIHAFLSITLKADQVISGTAINLFSTAFSAFMISRVFTTGGQTDAVEPIPKLPTFFKNVPILGYFISEINYFVIFAIVAVIIVSFIFNKSVFGLRIKAVGEHPRAADTLGINVCKVRYLCVILSGVLAALGGASLTIGLDGIYREGMIAGRGFIAIAALIFGNWKPKGMTKACLLFGFATAFQFRAQGFGWSLPIEFYYVLPYVLTMLALAGFVGKTTAPKALGKPYGGE